MNGDDRAIPLCEAWFDAREHERVREALAGHTSGDGPFGRKVEQRLADALGVPRVLLTTSCTHAIELALLALGIGPGDEIICPSFTFVSTAGAALRVGARPVFADIERRTLGLDPADVERRLTPRTRAILPVHYAGVAADMDALLSVARSRGVAVVEDAAQGLDARYRGRPLGSLGDAGCFSFHATKHVTCGEGGALALRDPGLIARAEIAREKGTNRSAFFRGEVDRYTWVAEGSSYVLSDILAAVLDVQLDKAAEIVAHRKRIAARYRSELSGWAAENGIGLSPTYEDRDDNGQIFYLMFPSGASRDRAMAALRGRGIMAAFHYVPLHSSPQGSVLHDGKPLPVTDCVATSLLRLPIYPGLRDAELTRVIAAVRECLA